MTPQDLARAVAGHELVPPFAVHRDEHGFADSIDDSTGFVVVHLHVGTMRSENGVETLVTLLNNTHSRHAAMVGELRPYLHHADNCGDADAYNNVEPWGRKCDCGLDAILSTHAPESKEEGRG
jgi:hypothetical protein